MSEPGLVKLRKTPILWIAAGALWLGGVIAGFGLLYVHAFTPGEAGSLVDRWPAETVVGRNLESYALVVAAHPECPCSRATVAELASVIEAGHGRVSATVLFLDEPALPEPPESTELWAKARAIPGVRLMKDLHGREARRFGARTSGETRLYGPDGVLLFHGGITGSRGHEGDNPGQEAVIALVNGQRSSAVPRSTPVFGCDLFEPLVAANQ